MSGKSLSSPLKRQKVSVSKCTEKKNGDGVTSGYLLSNFYLTTPIMKLTCQDDLTTRFIFISDGLKL